MHQKFPQPLSPRPNAMPRIPRPEIRPDLSWLQALPSFVGLLQSLVRFGFRVGCVLAIRQSRYIAEVSLSSNVGLSNHLDLFLHSNRHSPAEAYMSDPGSHAPADKMKVSRQHPADLLASRGSVLQFHPWRQHGRLGTVTEVFYYICSGHFTKQM